MPSSSELSCESDSDDTMSSRSGWKEFCLVLRLVFGWGRMEGCLRGGRGGICVVKSRERDSGEAELGGALGFRTFGRV
jgi:hypothetical protein